MDDVSGIHVCLAGPVLTAPFAAYLDDDISRAPVGLGGSAVWQLALGLLERGVQLTVCSLSTDVAEPTVLRGRGIDIRYGPYRRRHRMRDLMRAEREVLEQSIRAAKPDLVHAQWSYEYALAALDSGCPTVITVRDWAPTILRYSPDAYRLGRFLMNRRALRRGSHFVAASPHIQRRVSSATHRPVELIPNPIDSSIITDGHNPLRRSAPVLISVNNGFGRLKNVFTLLRAFPAVRSACPGAELRLVGADYEQGGPAARWATTRGLASGVVFLGPRPRHDVLALMDDADVLVHPALEESFGNVVVEAAARGTVVIGGSRSGAIPWVLGDGAYGVLSDVSSHAALARDIVRLLGDSHRWTELSRQTLKHLPERFSIGTVVDLHLGLYEATLAATTGGGA
jgi:glycosyltransferase involved in cell wall biosynthesis